MTDTSRSKLSPSDETTSLLGNRQQGSRTHQADIDSLGSRNDSYSDIIQYRGVDDEDYDHEHRRLLDPDDPAVSPLNLKVVQSMRLGLTILLAFTYVWAIILFVNCFVSVPLIKLRTSGFLELE